ncbi:hypothetical protein DFQ30_000246 [Apophysomyces sp. BC1015]|nr:hypothetical protein DFQ30_000246 [Apophysomyces sp. BC1015]
MSTDDRVPSFILVNVPTKKRKIEESVESPRKRKAKNHKQGPVTRATRARRVKDNAENTQNAVPSVRRKMQNVKKRQKRPNISKKECKWEAKDIPMPEMEQEKAERVPSKEDHGVEKEDIELEKKDTEAEKKDTEAEKEDTEVEKEDTEVEKEDTEVEKEDTEVEKEDTEVEKEDTEVEKEDTIMGEAESNETGDELSREKKIKHNEPGNGTKGGETEHTPEQPQLQKEEEKHIQQSSKDGPSSSSWLSTVVDILMSPFSSRRRRPFI